jgi:hypothetical protein
VTLGNTLVVTIQRNDGITLTTANQEYHDSIRAEPEKNADMGIVVPAEKIDAWSLVVTAVRD